MKSCSQSDEVFEFTAEAGPFSVGLKIVEQYDHSRVFGYSTDCLGEPLDSARSRPLQTLIWYPAQSGGPKRMTVGDYVALSATETTFGSPRLPVGAQEWLAGLGGAAAATLRAMRDAPMEAQCFPVVIYAPSFSSTAWENADLCEYLASHGYVVLSSPCMGERSRAMTANVAGIEAQARDISFLVGYANSLGNADPTRIAVIGFSWGGLSNVVAAARDPRIGTLIGLDGSLRYWPGFVTRMGVRPEQMTIPLLSIVQGHWTPEGEAAARARFADRVGPSVMNAWVQGDLVTVRMLGLSHVEHCSMYQRNEEVWWKLLHVYGDKMPDYGRADGIVGYRWMARYCLGFLDAYLKRNSAAMTFLKNSPAKNGVPRHTMVTSFRAGQGLSASFDAFRAEVGRQGFDRIGDVYQTFRARQADFSLDEASLLSWSEDLLNRDSLMQALVLLEFNIQLYPHSTNAHTALAKAHHRRGERELSVKQYCRAVEIDPKNADALWKLQQLGERARETPG
jgi:dienelactone hydrolase